MPSTTSKTISSKETTPVHKLADSVSLTETVDRSSNLNETNNISNSNKIRSKFELPTQSASIPKTPNPILSTPKTRWDGNFSTKIEEMTEEPQPRRFYKVTKL